jgi:hypothetical protein
MSTSRIVALSVLLVFSSSAFSQWKDQQLLSEGGESSVATDGKGDVYVAMHEPGQLFASHDWGATFTKRKEFAECFCDMDVLAWPNGDLNLSFIIQNTGFASYYSTDNGATLKKGSAPTGPLDREWMAPNLKNGEIYMDYSNGYIGGPKSIGVFLAASSDHGKTFEQRTRVDKEPAGDGPVDPYLASSSDGRIYAMWSTSKDQNLIDRFDFAYSTDGGHTFEGHQTIAPMHPAEGDTQERWILGAIASFGPKTVVAVFPDYTPMTVDGVEVKPLLGYYRVSTDGGATFSDPKLVTPQAELQASLKNFYQHKHSDVNLGIYVQTLPWLCSDPSGRFYMAYQDNRDGQIQPPGSDQYIGQWHVRLATMPSVSAGFQESERVSKDVSCYRPPLDFLSCAADSKNIYVSWTDAPGSTAQWAFSGQTSVARRALAKE